MSGGLEPLRVRRRSGMAQFSLPIDSNSIQAIVQPGSLAFSGISAAASSNLPHLAALEFVRGPAD
jgi:hypothetical protein